MMKFNLNKKNILLCVAGIVVTFVTTYIVSYAATCRVYDKLKQEEEEEDDLL